MELLRDSWVGDIVRYSECEMPLGKLYPIFVAVYVGPVLHRAAQLKRKHREYVATPLLGGFRRPFLTPILA